ncbi:unnamed protein product [Colias eurytheme]|nr:unnamed protein product [Colias eurytheme]
MDRTLQGNKNQNELDKALLEDSQEKNKAISKKISYNRSYLENSTKILESPRKQNKLDLLEGSQQKNGNGRIYEKTPKNIPKFENIDRTIILERIKNQNELDKALLEDSQDRKSEVNERAFIYIKSVKPVHNHLFNTDRGNKFDSHLLPGDEVFDDVARKFFDNYMKNGFFKARGSEETIQTNQHFVTQAFQDENHKDFETVKQEKNDIEEKRDYLELLKVPLLRSLSQSNDLKQLKFNTFNLPYYTTEMKKDEIELDEAETNNQVDKFIEQIISSSFEKPIDENKNKSVTKSNITEKHCDDCLKQIDTVCQCKLTAQVIP